MNSRGDGRIFQRKGTGSWWCAYYLRGKEYRESTGETEQKKGQKFLDRKLKEVHADQIGAKSFVGPQQERIKVAELLDALEADYRLRGKESPQLKAHLRPLRDHFNDWRAWRSRRRLSTGLLASFWQVTRLLGSVQRPRQR